jgi:hypothetical protein
MAASSFGSDVPHLEAAFASFGAPLPARLSYTIELGRDVGSA